MHSGLPVEKVAIKPTGSTRRLDKPKPTRSCWRRWH